MAGGVVVVAVGAFVLLRFVFFQDTTTAVDAGEVIARYRASTTTSSAAPASTAVATTATPATTVAPVVTATPVVPSAAVALTLPPLP